MSTSLENGMPDELQDESTCIDPNYQKAEDAPHLEEVDYDSGNDQYGGRRRRQPNLHHARVKPSDSPPPQYSHEIQFEDGPFEDEVDGYFYQEPKRRRRSRSTFRSFMGRTEPKRMMEVNFDEDEDIKYSDNGCPLYCSFQMNLSLAQQLIFKEDKDPARCCVKLPMTFTGQCSVYLINLRECPDINYYYEIADDSYGAWGKCSNHCAFYMYRTDGSVERVTGKTRRGTHDFFWDFCIQENYYPCHPVTAELNSKFKRKIYTVRYNGQGAEVVKTWAIIAYEWTDDPVYDLEYPAKKMVTNPAFPRMPRSDFLGMDEWGTGQVIVFDDEIEGGSIKYSGNGCPVYLSQPLNCRLAEELIFGSEKREELTCDKVPSGFVGRNSIFLMNLAKMPNVNVLGDLSIDSYGTWGKCNSTCWFFRYGEDGTIEKVIAKQTKKEWMAPDMHWDFCLQENLYPCHPQCKDTVSKFKKRIFTLRDKRTKNELIKTWAVIGYMWSGEPIKLRPLPHGAARKEEAINSPYSRTRPSVLRMIREKILAGMTAKEILSSIHDDMGGVIGCDSIQDLPQSKRQIYNMIQVARRRNLIPSAKEMKQRRKVSKEPILPTRPWNPERSPCAFIAEYDFVSKSGDPVVLCADERMMTLFRMYCLLEQPTLKESRPLYIDTTFELGSTFITPVMTQHPEFEEKFEDVRGDRKEPILPIAWLVSKDKTKDEFKWLGEALKRNCGGGEGDRVSAVITDDDPEMFGGLSECSLFDEPCCFILCGVGLQQNVRQVLEECRTDSDSITSILGQIFGREHQFSVDKGRHKSDRPAKGLIDCRTVNEFDEMLEGYETEWDPTFYNWFIKYKVPYIRNRFFVSGSDSANGWINANRIEAMKFCFQNALQNDYTEENIVETLRIYTDSLYAKLEGAPFDIGDYHCKNPNNRWLNVSTAHFNETTKAQRIVRMEEFGLNKLTKERTEMLMRPNALSLLLSENLKIPYMNSTNAGRVSSCEKAAGKFITDECIKALRIRNQYAVEDVVGNIAAIFVVEKQREPGVFKCQYGYQACEAFKMFNYCFCEHTVAVAEFLGLLADHIEYINSAYPGVDQTSITDEMMMEEAFEKKRDLARVIDPNILPSSVSKAGRPKKVVNVMNPMMESITLEREVSFTENHQSTRSPNRRITNPRHSGSVPIEKKVSKPGPKVKSGYPSAAQLSTFRKEKALLYDGVPEHAYYNSNKFYLMQGSPPVEPGRKVVKCKKCKLPFPQEGDPGFLPPADMYLAHEEVEIGSDPKTGELLVGDEEVKVYLHVRHGCIASRYPYFFPSGYLSCDAETKELFQDVHKEEIKSQFGVSLEYISTD